MCLYVCVCVFMSVCVCMSLCVGGWVDGCVIVGSVDGMKYVYVQDCYQVSRESIQS